MTCADVERLVEAYADAELGLEDTLALEAHVAQCDACRARLDGIRAVTRALHAAPYYRAPEALAARVRATAPPATSLAPPRPARVVMPARRRWQPWLIAVAGVAAVLVVALVLRPALGDDATAEAVIEGHMRSLMAGHLTDVASTDRHTVKPWFAGRIDFSPTVVDLAGDGFPLVGGRLDYLDHHSAAALVYKRGEHAINVFLWPQTAGSPVQAAQSDPRGYHLVHWTRAGVAVWIVSDVAAADLADFARKLDAAMRQ